MKKIFKEEDVIKILAEKYAEATGIYDMHVTVMINPEGSKGSKFGIVIEPGEENEETEENLSAPRQKLIETQNHCTKLLRSPVK